jgi:hypothetical protein
MKLLDSKFVKDFVILNMIRNFTFFNKKSHIHEEGVYFSSFMLICRVVAFIVPQQQALSGLQFGTFIH